jgi:alpha-tubulin suppressor-like RCC1 family protein
LGDQKFGTLDTDGQVTLIPEGAGITAGFGHTCALSRSATVSCWGANYLGQCGKDPGHSGEACPGNVTVSDPSTLLPTAPNVITLPDTVITKVRTVKHTTCALTQVGSLFCWGANQGGVDPGDNGTSDFILGLTSGGGQLAIPGTTCFRASAGAAVNAQPIDDFSLGFASAYMLVPRLEDFNGLDSWGMNASGQLGRVPGATQSDCAFKSADDVDNTDMDPVPDRVDTSGGQFTAVAKSFSSEGSDQCAVQLDGEFQCWGVNDHGELGTSIPTGQSVDCAMPLTLESHGLLDLKSASAHDSSTPMFARGDDFACVVAPAHSSQIWCWGAVPGYGQTAEPIVISQTPAP